MATVWIEGNECLGAGTCSDLVPEVFHDRGDGIWAVKEDGSYFGNTVVFDGRSGEGHGPDGYQGRARIPGELLDLVVEAAEECPAECIYVEV